MRKYQVLLFCLSSIITQTFAYADCRQDLKVGTYQGTTGDEKATCFLTVTENVGSTAMCDLKAMLTPPMFRENSQEKIWFPIDEDYLSQPRTFKSQGYSRAAPGATLAIQVDLKLHSPASSSFSVNGVVVFTCQNFTAISN